MALIILNPRMRLRTFSRVALASLLAIGIAVGIAQARRIRLPVADEHWYAEQIRLFMAGRWQVSPAVTMVPAYHFAVAAIARLFGPYSDFVGRMVSLGGSLLLLPLVARIARRHVPEVATIRAVQVFFLPLAYPYFFLMYTDIWALVALALMVEATLERRIAIAAVAGIAGVLVRQDFIVWVAFAWILVVARHLDWRDPRGAIGTVARRSWGEALPLAVALLAFLAYVAWHHSIAIGDIAHQRLHPNPANIDLFFACAWLVFLPLAFTALPRIAAVLRRPSGLAVLIAGFLAYVTTYSNAHPYNQAHLRFFLHNELLYRMDTQPAVLFALYIPIAWGALLLLTTRLPERRYEVLYAVAPIAFLLHPMVEQRYYLPALVLYNAWRPFAGRRMEWLLLALYVPFAIFVLREIVLGAFFP